MKPPKKIAVGPFDVTVERDTDARINLAAERRAGEYNQWWARIRLDPDLPPSASRDTFIHEVMHVIMHVTGLDFEFVDGEDEKLVRRLSPIILDTLRRNPKLVAYLLEKD